MVVALIILSVLLAVALGCIVVFALQLDKLTGQPRTLLSHLTHRRVPWSPKQFTNTGTLVTGSSFYPNFVVVVFEYRDEKDDAVISSSGFIVTPLQAEALGQSLIDGVSKMRSRREPV